LHEESAGIAVGRWEHPSFIHQLRKLDLASPRPRILHTGRHHKGVVKELFHGKRVGNRAGYSRYRQLNIALGHVAVELQISPSDDVEYNTRIAAGEPIDHRKSRPRCRSIGATDPQLSGGRVGQELDVHDALSDLIEDRDATLDDRAAIMRRLNAAPAAVE